MDRFLTHEGQQPIWLGDIDFMASAFRNTVAELVRGMGFGSSSFILYGLDFESERIGHEEWTFSWNAGVVVIDGELYPVEAGKFDKPVNLEFVGFKVNKSFDPKGRRKMKNGEEKECYELRKAVVVYGQADLYIRWAERFKILVKQNCPSPNERNLGYDTFEYGDYRIIVKLFEIAGKFYMSYEVACRSPRPTEGPDLSADMAIDLEEENMAFSVFSDAGAETIAFPVYLVKEELNGEKKALSPTCLATLSVESNKKLRIKINSDHNLQGPAKYNGRGFIRLSR